ncbi:low molecular weight protein-tyrosine-phosphatase [Nocardia sp. 004]|uniref:low molecular weight protein-tyrosine-phosphatase n=1 Tax=Nocardia sp. 004 TaxID=3385978 RepID=UPI0039A3F1AC
MAVVGQLHVLFVCTGNICRSPMAEKIFSVHLYRAGLAHRVRVSSVGIGSWHVGTDADPRAEATLRKYGYPTGHAAAAFDAEHRDADLIIALDRSHQRELLRLGVEPERLHLLRTFDPAADSPEIADPYSGDIADFERVRDQIEAAIPGLLNRVRAELGPVTEPPDPDLVPGRRP